MTLAQALRNAGLSMDHFVGPFDVISGTGTVSYTVESGVSEALAYAEIVFDLFDCQRVDVLDSTGELVYSLER